MPYTRRASLSETPPAQYDVHVWTVALPACEVGRNAVRLLSSAERTVMSRFAFGRDERRYGWSHVALRLILASYRGCDPADVELRSGASGKPRLAGTAPQAQLEFNMSHSDNVALVAVGRVPLGVDVERAQSLPDASFHAASFTPSERAWLESAGEGAALRLWTRKEAFLKATGEGLLGRPLDSVEILDVWAIPGWRIVDLDPAPGYVAAAAVRANVTQLVERRLDLEAALLVRLPRPVLGMDQQDARTDRIRSVETAEHDVLQERAAEPGVPVVVVHPNE